MANPKKETFSCTTMKSIVSISPAALKDVSGKIYNSLCYGKRAKYVNLTKRECQNDLPVLENWIKGMNKEKKDSAKIPEKFDEKISKKVRCGIN